MYHRIANVKGDRNSLPPENFEEQLQYLSSHGYTSISVTQLEKHLLFQASIPEKPVVLTFDDGYKDNFTVALPLLKKYGQIGNVFSISNWQGKENKWENFGKELTLTMDKEELHKWQSFGNYVGSHTVDHPFLADCSTERLHFELVESKAAIESVTGVPATCICYPYGNFNANVIEVAKQCGYKLGLGIFDNVPIWTQDLLALPRIPIPSHQKMWEFKLKVSSIHLIFVWLRKLEREFKRKIKQKK